MKNKSVLNKLLLLIIIFLFCFLFNINKSQAHIDKYDFINEKFGSYGWVLYKSTDNNIYLAVSEKKNNYNELAYYENAFCLLNSNNCIFFSMNSTDENLVTTVIYQVDKNYNFTKKCEYMWQASSYSPYSNVSDIIDLHLSRDITKLNSSTILYNIEDYNGYIVDPFLESPLALAMKVEMEEKTIAMTLVGLVGLLMAFLICLIGFWKALHLLLRILRKV